MGATKPLAVDLFSGAGGMSLGFHQAGFNVAAAFDYNSRCVDIHGRNFPGSTSKQADLSSASGADLLTLGGLKPGSIDVLFGGPPCGGFSVAGQRRPNDPRNKLLLRFAEFVGELKPKYFVVENVKGLMIGGTHSVLEKFRALVQGSGYKLVWPVKVLNAADFGVPQRRERIFILGCLKTMTLPVYPTPTTPRESDRRVTVEEAISDLAVIDEHSHRIDGDTYRGPIGAQSTYARGLLAGVEGQRKRDAESTRKHRLLSGCLRVEHSKDAVSRFRKTKQGTREPISRFYRLSATGVSPTLRAGTDADHGKFTAVRPIHYARPRCITVREAARLHSYPDWFQFHPTKWHGFMQIGNSVPPMLSRAVARSVLRAMSK